MLFQERCLIKGALGVESCSSQDGCLIALERCKRTQVLGVGLETVALHQLLDDLIPDLLLLFVLGDIAHWHSVGIKLGSQLVQDLHLPVGKAHCHVRSCADGLALLRGLLEELQRFVRHLVEHIDTLSHDGNIYSGSWLWPSGGQDGSFLAQDAPTMLTDVRADWGEDDHLPLVVSEDKGLVWQAQTALADVAILIKCVHELEVNHSQGFAEVHPRVVALCGFH
mmetsp:Transcript_66053/g.157951  ORF Transcript_66053/g.157951 Transcript_66053/m.157951 type:complete len:224 (-) Transcript_66053:2845-3516(-)